MKKKYLSPQVEEIKLATESLMNVTMSIQQGTTDTYDSQERDMESSNYWGSVFDEEE